MSYQSDVRDFMVLGGQEVRSELVGPVSRFGCDRPVGSCMNISTLLWLAVRGAERLAEESPSLEALSVRLLLEEVRELVSALFQGDLVETVDGAVDTTYIVMGIANRFGFDFDAAWGEVHASNLAKFPGGVAVLDSAGKLKKPAGWLPPDPDRMVQPYAGA